MFNKRIVSFSEARNGLKSVLDPVVNDVDYTIITRRDAEDAVLMSMDHYNSLMETVHLLKSPANAAHLSKSIEQFQSGKIIQRETLMTRLLAWTDEAWLTMYVGKVRIRKH